MSTEVRLATLADHAWLATHDRHLDSQTIQRKVEDKETLMLTLDQSSIGWLRWGYFWDQIPFMNMLMVLAAYRNQGYGAMLVTAWEDRMRTAGHKLVLTSTQANEDAQHFYRKLGYRDAGGIIFLGEPIEIILTKILSAG